MIETYHNCFFLFHWIDPDGFSLCYTDAIFFFLLIYIDPGVCRLRPTPSNRGGDRHRLNSPLLPWQQCSVNNVNYCNSPLMYGSTGETRSEVSVADAIWEVMRLLLKSFVRNKLYFSTIGYCQLNNKRKRHL